MGTSENTASANMDPMIKNELGPDNLKSIVDLGVAINAQAQAQQIEAHLILVGGNVKPEKRGRMHKDVDLVLYSPQLATEIFFGGEHPRFDIFASFVSAVGNQLGWDVEIDNPWFNDYESCGDGKVVLSSGEKPIEVLPVRRDRLSNSFEEYLKSNTDPYVVIF